MRDAQLHYLRDPGTHRPESHAHFRAIYAAGKAAGLRPTKIALRQDPIRFHVYHDGKIALDDGRHRYAAAHANGATRIAARVVQYGPRGGVRAERVGVIKLR